MLAGEAGQHVEVVEQKVPAWAKMSSLVLFDMHLVIFDIITKCFAIFVTILPLFAHYLFTICPLFAYYLPTIPDPNAEKNFPSLGT